MPIIILLLRALVTTAWVVMLGRVLMSWIDPQLQRPVSRLLFGLTEPFLAPIRNVLPRTGMLDLSPLLLFIGLGILMRLVLAL